MRGRTTSFHSLVHSCKRLHGSSRTDFAVISNSVGLRIEDGGIGDFSRHTGLTTRHLISCLGHCTVDQRLNASSPVCRLNVAVVRHGHRNSLSCGSIDGLCRLRSHFSDRCARVVSLFHRDGIICGATIGCCFRGHSRGNI